jgi:hypothetical protein
MPPLDGLAPKAVLPAAVLRYNLPFPAILKLRPNSASRRFVLSHNLAAREIKLGVGPTQILIRQQMREKVASIGSAIAISGSQIFE